MEKKLKDLVIIILKNGWLYFGIVFLIGLFSILGIILSSKIDISGSVDCNSGRVDIKYEQNYREEKIPDFYGSYINITNQTKFKEIPLYLKFNGVDNLNCKGSLNIAGNPIIIKWLMEGKND